MKRLVAIAAAALVCAAAFAGEVSVGGRLIGSYDLLGAVSLGHEYTSKTEGVVDESNTDITWQAGLAADLNCGIKAGPGTVVIDLRFTKGLFDSEGDFGLGDRWSNLTFGAGYQYTF